MFLNNIHAVTQNTELNSILLPDGLTYSEKILSRYSTGLVALWGFNDTSGLSAIDLSGNNRPLTYSGCTLANRAGPGASMGNLALWDGVNDEAFRANEAALNPANLTIAGWIYPRSWSTFKVITQKCSDGGWGDGYHLYWTADALRFAVGSYINLAAFSYTSTDAWLHIAGTFDGANVRIYAAGALEDEQPNANNPSTAGRFAVGSQSFSSLFNFDGNIGWLGLWNIAQPAEVIADLATAL